MALSTLYLGLWLATFTAASPYPLDGVSREVPRQGKVRCPKVSLVRYAGRVIPYHRPARVHPAFAERLARFESVVAQVAIEHYGRPPTKVVHVGTYNCRRIRGYPHLISEHGLGNGIDIKGFDFGRLSPDHPLVERIPKTLRRPFAVRLGRHWEASGSTGKVHRAFLTALAQRLIARPDIFRVLLGPSFPGHKGHFHFDCSPWSLVDIFGDERDRVEH